MKNYKNILSMVFLIVLFNSCTSFNASWTVTTASEIFRGEKIEYARRSYIPSYLTLDKNLKEGYCEVTFWPSDQQILDFVTVPDLFLICGDEEFIVESYREGLTKSEWKVDEGAFYSNHVTGWYYYRPPELYKTKQKIYWIYLLSMDFNKSIDEFVFRTRDRTYEEKFTFPKITVDAVLSLGSENDRYKGIFNTSVPYK